MPGTKYKTQPRVKGKFVKSEATYKAPRLEAPIVTPLWFKLGLWTSHNRVEILYVILCLLAGALGGYLGTQYGLK